MGERERMMKIMLFVVAIMIWLFWNGYAPGREITIILAICLFLGFVFGDKR